MYLSELTKQLHSVEDLCHRHAKMEGVSVLDKYTETHKEQDVSSSMI